MKDGIDLSGCTTSGILSSSQPGNLDITQAQQRLKQSADKMIGNTLDAMLVQEAAPQQPSTPIEKEITFNPPTQQKLHELSRSNPHDAKAISCLGNTVKKCITDTNATDPAKSIQLTASPNTDHISRIFPITTEQAQAIHKEFIYNLRKAQDTIQHYQLELQPVIKALENELEEAMKTHDLSEEAKEDLRKHLHSYFNSDESVGDLGSILAKHYIVRNTDKHSAISQVLLRAQNDALFQANTKDTINNKALVRYAETLQSRLSVFCNNMIGGVPGLTQDTIDNDLAEAIQQIIESCERYDNTYVDQPALEFVERFSLMMVFNAKPSPFKTSPRSTQQQEDIQKLVAASMRGKIFSGYKYATIESLIAEMICVSVSNLNKQDQMSKPDQQQKIPDPKAPILSYIQKQRNGAARYCDMGGPRGRIDPRQSNSISSQPLPFPQGDSIAFVTNQSFALKVDQSTSTAGRYKTLSQEATGLNDAQYNYLFNSKIKRNSRYETCATRESVPPYLIDIINNPSLVWPDMIDGQAQAFRKKLRETLEGKLKSTQDYAVFLDCIDIKSDKWETKPSFGAKMIDNGIRTICSCSGTTILITGQLLKHMDLKKEDRDKMLNSLYDLSVAENPASKLHLDKNLIKLISSISLCMQLQQAHSAGEVIAGLYQMACSNNDTQPTLEGFENIMKLFAKYPDAFLQIPD